MSGKILGVNPFNQPGVEEYKKNMFKLLGKDKEPKKEKSKVKELVEKKEKAKKVETEKTEENTTPAKRGRRKKE